MKTKNMIKETKKTIGEIVLDNFGKICEFRPEYIDGAGSIYKNFEAYLNDESAICYIPELDDKGTDPNDFAYTKKDFLNLCNGQEEIANDIFWDVEMESPKERFDYLIKKGFIGKCSCGKLYNTLYDGPKETCDYCGKELPDKDAFIRLHRILWNRIAEANEQEEEADPQEIIESMKEEKLLAGMNSYPKDNSFLCEYTNQRNEMLGDCYSDTCYACPLCWGDRDEKGKDEADCELGPWASDGLVLQHDYACEDEDFEEAAEIAKMIAELPEKEYLPHYKDRWNNDWD